MDTNLRSVTIWPEPEAAEGFLRLPRELRHRIYEETLLDVPKWRRLHRPECEHAPRDTHSTICPPFVDSEIYHEERNVCRCRRRQGINLLRTNRQILRETAPIFWSHNTFLFDRVDQVAEGILENLRPSYRLLLRHICVLLQQNDSMSSNRHDVHRVDHLDSLWTSVLQCQGLQTLELHYSVFHGCLHYARHLRTHLPALRELNVIGFMAYKLWPPREEFRQTSGRPSTPETSADAAGPHPVPPATATATPATPAVPLRYVSLNPIHDEFRYSAPILERTLLFKVGVTVPDATIDAITHDAVVTPFARQQWLPGPLWVDDDDDADTNYGAEVDTDDEGEGPGAADDAYKAAADAYNHMLRSFRTNFLVHMRHAIYTQLPAMWARDTPGRPLRLPHFQPKKMQGRRKKEIRRKLRRNAQRERRIAAAAAAHGDDAVSYYGYDSPSDTSDGVHSDVEDSLLDALDVDDRDAFGDTPYAAEALRLVAGRLPLRLRDGPATCTLSLRDGSTHTIEVMGLPSSEAARKAALRAQLRAAWQKRAEGTKPYWGEQMDADSHNMEEYRAKMEQFDVDMGRLDRYIALLNEERHACAEARKQAKAQRRQDVEEQATTRTVERKSTRAQAMGEVHVEVKEREKEEKKDTGRWPAPPKWTKPKKPEPKKPKLGGKGRALKKGGRSLARLHWPAAEDFDDVECLSKEDLCMDEADSAEELK